MKKAEIEVGAELFKATGNDWMTDRYSHRRVVVLDDKFYRRVGSEWSGKHIPDPKGTKVLVRSYRVGETEHHQGYNDYVTLGHLRGLFADVKPQVDAAIKARDDRLASDAASRVALNARYDACIVALQMEGVVARRSGGGHGAVLTLQIDQAEHLCRILRGEA